MQWSNLKGSLITVNCTRAYCVSYCAKVTQSKLSAYLPFGKRSLRFLLCQTGHTMAEVVESEGASSAKGDFDVVLTHLSIATINIREELIERNDVEGKRVSWSRAWRFFLKKI